MKKLIAIFGVLAFSAGMAFSQNNDATVNQEGNNHVADVSQTGLLNIADVEQSANSGDYAKVKQLGEENKAYVTQDGAAGTHHAEVDQEGDRNEATIDRQGIWGSALGEAFITQLGNDNKAFQNQHANKASYALIDQDGNDNYADQNMAAEFGGGGTGHTAYIYQEGDDNYAYQHQRGRSHYAYIDQDGYDNHAWMSQDNGGVDVYNNWAKIDQEGDHNWAAVDQDGNTNTFNLKQEGNENKVFGLDAFEEFKQVGDGNIANTMLQKGDNNRIFGGQSGDFNTMNVSQIGNGNKATVIQNQ